MYVCYVGEKNVREVINTTTLIMINYDSHAYSPWESQQANTRTIYRDTNVIFIRCFCTEA